MRCLTRLADLERLGGRAVRGGVGACARVDVVLRDRGHRRVTHDESARALLAAAPASAELSGDVERWLPGTVRLLCRTAGLAALIRVAPGQALARAHVLLARGVLADELLGRLRGVQRWLIEWPILRAADRCQQKRLASFLAPSRTPRSQWSHRSGRRAAWSPAPSSTWCSSRPASTRRGVIVCEAGHEPTRMATQRRCGSTEMRALWASERGCSTAIGAGPGCGGRDRGCAGCHRSTRRGACIPHKAADVDLPSLNVTRRPPSA